MTDTQTAFVLVPREYGVTDDELYKAALSAAPKPPESEIGPVAWRVWDSDLRSWVLCYTEEALANLPIREPLYPQARIDADAATIAALRAKIEAQEELDDTVRGWLRFHRDRAEAAEARVKELEAAIGGCLCPRPFNSRPHGFTISECVGAGECGCSDGEALASKTATDDDRETEIQWRNRDEDDLRDSIERERDE